MSEDLYEPDFDLAEFRNLSARYVKLLIRARWKNEPEFLSSQELSRWKLEDILADRWDAASLLGQAANTLAKLNMDFLPRCGSGGVAPTDQNTPVGRLVDALAFLVTCPHGGGPDHNLALLEAARARQDGGKVCWEKLVNWPRLPQIRDDLDQLPDSPQASTHFLEKMDDETILVQFGAERGIMTGKAAFRLQRLFAWSQVGALVLGGDVLLGVASGSIFDPSQLDGIVDSEDAHDNATYGMPSLKKYQIGDLATIIQEVQKLDAAILAAKSEVERAPLEKQKRVLRSYLRNLQRPDPSQVSKAKQRVERGIRTLKTDLLQRMPGFATHLDLVRFDALTETFVYEPADRPPWAFIGFD